MKQLMPLLEDFNLNSFNSPEALDNALMEIAKRVLFGGHFSIDNQLDVYPCDIEFYCHSDKSDAPKWKKDYGMYHTGDLPYFPKCSLFPHSSGIDFRFEDESEQFRASFLIRGYEFHDANAQKEEEKHGRVNNPTYLWEDLFGSCRFDGQGLNIKWVDEPLEEGTPNVDVRFNLCKYDDHYKPTIPGPNDEPMKGKKNRVQDPKLWRFKR